MGSPHEELVYQGILRMVLWDEPKEEIYHKLGVNGIVGEAADQIYQRALTERIREIRSRCLRKMLLGSGILLGALILFFVILLFFYRAYPIILVGALFGVWKLGDGISRYLLASSYKGSIADEE